MEPFLFIAALVLFALGCVFIGINLERDRADREWLEAEKRLEAQAALARIATNTPSAAHFTEARRG